MRDRRIVYSLIVVFAVGLAVTFSAWRLTGAADGDGKVMAARTGEDASVSGGPAGASLDAEEGPAVGEGRVRTADGGTGGSAVPAAGGTAAGESGVPAAGGSAGEDLVRMAGGAAAAEEEARPDGSAAAVIRAAGGQEEPLAEGYPYAGGADGAGGPAPIMSVPPAAGPDGAETALPADEAGNAEPEALSGAEDPSAESGALGQPVIELSPLETTAGVSSVEDSASVSGNGAESAGGETSAGEDNPYLVRLEELDAQIERNRGTQDASGSLTKNAASSELKLWDGELNAIYNEILKHLDEQQTQELVKAERQWMKDRDAAAVDAAKSSAGGFRESVEYTVSLAASTRSRAYELVDLYGYLLGG